MDRLDWVERSRTNVTLRMAHWACQGEGVPPAKCAAQLRIFGALVLHLSSFRQPVPVEAPALHPCTVGRCRTSTPDHMLPTEESGP